jgi:hypothetical protein
MITSNKEKGKSLEEAVHAIESFIFASEPSLKHSTIVFERNKIVTLKGARSEIDLYANINLGKDYEVIYLFECKNWNKKIGKNEIIVFSEKIRELNAQKGFVMGKEFTKDAIERANQDGRIKIVKVKNEITLDTFPISNFSSRILKSKMIIKGDIEKRSYGWNEVFELDGKKTGLREIYDKLMIEFDDHLHKCHPELMLKEHIFEKEEIFPFESRRLTFEGKNIEGIKIEAEIKVTEIKPIVKSQFDIENRGRYCTIQFNDPDTLTTFETSFAQL